MTAALASQMRADAPLPFAASASSNLHGAPARGARKLRLLEPKLIPCSVLLACRHIAVQSVGAVVTAPFWQSKEELTIHPPLPNPMFVCRIGGCTGTTAGMTTASEGLEITVTNKYLGIAVANGSDDLGKTLAGASLGITMANDGRERTMASEDLRGNHGKRGPRNNNGLLHAVGRPS